MNERYKAYLACKTVEDVSQFSTNYPIPVKIEDKPTLVPFIESIGGLLYLQLGESLLVKFSDDYSKCKIKGGIWENTTVEACKLLAYYNSFHVFDESKPLKSQNNSKVSQKAI